MDPEQFSIDNMPLVKSKLIFSKWPFKGKFFSLYFV